MKKLHYRIIFYFTGLLVCLLGTTKAQEAISPNGKFATVNGLKLYYEDTGQGMPLIYLHGFSRTGVDWKYHADIAKYFRVIAIDMPGHGHSNWMDTTLVYSHKKAAGYILALLEQLRIDSSHVMGLSSGGMVALHMSTLKPQLIKKMIIIGSQVYFSAVTRQVIARQGLQMEQQMAEVTKVHGKEKGVLLLKQFYHFHKLYGDPSFTPDELSTIQAKTFIIHGDNDPIAPVSNAWEMYQHIPKAYLWIVPNGGHVPFIVAGNMDDFNRRLIGFLREDKP